MRKRRLLYPHDRDIPLEGGWDRHSRAMALDFGRGSSIYRSSYVYGDVEVGDYTWIGPFTILDGSAALITIGSHCSISAGVQIYTHDTVAWAVSGGKSKYAEGGPIIIGNNCYIGPNAVIVRGVTIGTGSIIGSNSVVTFDVPQRHIVIPAPMRMEKIQWQKEE